MQSQLRCYRLLLVAIIAASIILILYLGGSRWRGKIDRSQTDDKLLIWQEHLKAAIDRSMKDGERLLNRPKQLKAINARSNLTVICMIFTTPNRWLSRGVAVQNTWSRRCPRHIFFYSKSAANCPNHDICSVPNSVGLDVPEGRDHLTGKTVEALKYSYRMFGRSADWYLKADDDVYIFFENLLEVLSWYNSTSPRYLGQTLHTNIPAGYQSGGAGYVLNKPAVTKMFENQTQFQRLCKQDGSYEDVDIGACLAAFGIYPEDMRDAEGRLRFHSLNPLRILNEERFLNDRFINFSGATFGNRKAKGILEMLGRQTTSFHYVRPGEMYFIEFLVYHLNQR